MPSEAAPEKAGSAEHGDGATVRCYHDSNRQLSFSLLVVKEPIWAIEQPINLARHDEVVLMQSFDLLGAQRDSRTTPSESKPIRWTTLAPIGQRSFFLRKRSAEIGIHHHVAGAYLLRYAQERSWRGTTAVCRTVSKSTASQLCL